MAIMFITICKQLKLVNYSWL